MGDKAGQAGKEISREHLDALLHLCLRITSSFGGILNITIDI